ncbi:MAG: hypothetical protein J6Y82_11680 [Bacteroidales bacterium]|nr:hypothetical protein [Bacteroidales bacterium]
MADRIFKIMQGIGVVLIIASFLLWSYKYRLSDICFWTALALIAPKIFYDARQMPLKVRVVRVLAFAGLILAALWFFNGPVVRCNIPGLPKITIHRQ